jgi:membrane protein implicated in regulation of membrane protease activity
MGIGTGIFLFVVGAILAFAINVQLTWIDLHLVGYILMGAGVVVFVISLVFVLRRRSTVATTRSSVDPSGTQRVEERETRGDIAP